MSNLLDTCILTPSQEMTLLNDQDVGQFMNSLNNMHQPPELFDSVYQVIETDNKNFHNSTYNIDEINNVAVVNTPPTLRPAVISNEEYDGPFMFDIFIDPHYNSKTPWVFSLPLNKLFINMNDPFPVDFKWESRLKNLFVRATPLFSLSQHVQELVTRCLQHSAGSDISNLNMSQEIWEHIIRCQSPAATYNGNLDQKIHFNVLVPLGTPQSGMDTVRLMYSFVCKNSCPSGMNRRPIEVVFTLEDENGTVFGRKKLSVRVCSCPKRDKEKEEKDYIKRNGTSAPALPHSKKLKVEHGEKRPLTVLDTPLDLSIEDCSFKIVGKRNKQLIYSLAYSLMAGEHCRHEANPIYKKAMNEISELIRNGD